MPIICASLAVHRQVPLASRPHARTNPPAIDGRNDVPLSAIIDQEFATGRRLPGCGTIVPGTRGSALNAVTAWLDRVDPGTHRRIKGLRLVTAYGLAAMLGTMPDIAAGLPNAAALPGLSSGFALWGSVSETRSTRAESSRDLLLLAAAAAAGAAGFILLAWLPRHFGHALPEAVLATGAFCVGYLRRFGVTGTGIGSQIFIGQLLAYSAGLGPADLPMVAVAGVLAAIASIVPRVLSGPAEQPPPAAPPMPVRPGWIGSELAMGVQAAASALAIVALNATVGLIEFGLGDHRLHLYRRRLRGRHDRPGQAPHHRHPHRRTARPGVPAAGEYCAVGGLGGGGAGDDRLRDGAAGAI